MAWIESHQALAKHPKTLKLARKLNIHIAQAIGHLHLFWWWAMEYAQDGDLSHCDPDDIAIAADWPGDAQHFVNTLVEVGFIDLSENGVLSIHDWQDYAGKLIAKRAADAERKRKERSKQDVQRTSNGNPTDVQRMSSVTITNTNKKEEEEDIYAHAREEKLAIAVRAIETHFGAIVNSTHVELLTELLDEGMEPELIESAARETRERGKGIDYFRGILKNCRIKGILSLSAYLEEKARHEQTKANGVRASPHTNTGPPAPQPVQFDDNDPIMRAMKEADQKRLASAGIELF